MSSDSLDQQILDAMRAQIPAGMELELPPKSFTAMQAEMIAFEPGQSLTVRLPVLDMYRNPMGMMQGGYIVSAIDNTIGPLSYLVARPSVTTQLNTSFVRPVTPDNETIQIVGRVTALTRRQLFLSAQVYNASGKLVAVGQAVNTVLEPQSE